MVRAQQRYPSLRARARTVAESSPPLNRTTAVGSDLLAIPGGSSVSWCAVLLPYAPYCTEKWRACGRAARAAGKVAEGKSLGRPLWSAVARYRFLSFDRLSTDGTRGTPAAPKKESGV